MANRPDKISRDDMLVFAVKVYEASSTMLPFPEWFEYYEDLVNLLFWNPEVDTPIAIGLRGPNVR